MSGDIVDQASEVVELLTIEALARRLPELPHNGHCYNCDDRLPTGTFCDSDCRRDHELRTRG